MQLPTGGLQALSWFLQVKVFFFSPVDGTAYRGAKSKDFDEAMMQPGRLCHNNLLAF